MNSTIQDVAALAGVSIKTVSRVVNAEPNVRDTTRHKVEKAIKELRYQPNPAARGLASNRSYLVGLFCDSALSETSYVAEVASGVLARCRQDRYELLLHPFNYHLGGSKNLAADITQHVQQSRIDGAIITPPLADLEVVCETLENLNKPFVRIAPGRYQEGSPCVHTHDLRAALNMTRHLIQLGHRRIGFIEAPPDHLAMGQRKAGYLQAMSEADIEVNPNYIIRSSVVTETQRSAQFVKSKELALTLLRQSKPPTAIFACTDEMAASVLSAAHELGIRVPDQLSVAGFDNSALSIQVWPTLTTVHQPSREMASTATDLLLNRLQGRSSSVREMSLETELIIRDSTGPAPK